MRIRQSLLGGGDSSNLYPKYKAKQWKSGFYTAQNSPRRLQSLDGGIKSETSDKVIISVCNLKSHRPMKSIKSKNNMDSPEVLSPSFVYESKETKLCKSVKFGKESPMHSFSFESSSSHDLSSNFREDVFERL